MKAKVKQDVTWETAQKMCEDIRNSEFFKRFAYYGSWVSGSSTVVYPVMAHQDEIVIQLYWNVPRRGRSAEFRKLLNGLKKKYTRRLFGQYCPKDGSCPDTYRIVFNERYEWFKPVKKSHKKGKAA